MKPQRLHREAPQVPPEAYDEERIPFDQVLRKLVNTKPVHKTAGPVKRNFKKPPKKA